MSFNIVDLVKDQLSDQVMGQIGKLMGGQSAQASSGIAAALPALLNGFSQRAAAPGGADALFGAFDSQDDGILDNLGSLLGGNDSKGMMDAGSSMLGSLFGNSGLGSLAGVISGISGLSKGNSGSLMGLLTPIIIGVIKRKLLGSGGFNVSSLLDMFKSQGSNINAAMPQGMSDQLSSSGFLSSISDVAGGVSNIADGARDAAGNLADGARDAAGNLADGARDAAGNLADGARDAVGNVADSASNTLSGAADTVSDAASGGSSIMKKLIPIIGLALLAWLGLKFFGGSADEVVDAAKDTASSAASTVAGAVDINVDELGTDLKGMFDSATSSLGGITDVDSAKAALPSLTEMGDKVSGLTDIFGKVPEATRGPLNGIIATGISALEPLIEKLSAIPGVGEILEPILKPIMETLSGLAG